MLWGLRQVEPQAAHGLAVDLLQRQIHSGLLLPAERLPAERQLSDRFGISRVTLREALRVLETNQYITVRRGAQGGAFVTDEERLSQLARRRMTRAPATTMRVVEFLTVNQLAAARLAAVRRGTADLKRMRQAMDMMTSAENGPQRKQSEALFFLAVGDAAQNPLLSRAIEDGLAELFLPFEKAGSEATASTALKSFEHLFQALGSEDIASSEAAMTDLHAQLWDTVRRLTRNAA
ncbi:GntR family transcriptional regulator protein [Rhizobium sp. N541]|nr:GntR family transcriptional regulator protein [Rhizobium sp. N324]ANM17053.1 GntR family transcriptional regulator protein [Rhizobium sp. N541]ANM23438.1 GntR family transcriptional regulator protein [Rhizobium sp. N941]OYD04140.1 GntR family transcriptional regulator protein [Rhizobium sp. N4311]